MCPPGLLLSLLMLLLSCACAFAQTYTVPADTELLLRLRQSLSSHGTDRGSVIVAEVIAPVEVDGVIVIPQGARVEGRVEEVRRVGLGFIRESARMKLSFERLVLPDAKTLFLLGQVSQVDNARETIDEQGRIQGIRATASFAGFISGVAVSASTVDPMLLAFGLTASLSAFRIPESEIVFPAGTELHYRLSQPLEITANFPALAPAISVNEEDREQLAAFVETLPFRTTTKDVETSSDLTNLVLLGTRDAIERSFDAAGWVQTDAHNSRSAYGTLRAVMENQGYREAPMSTLLLDGEVPEFTYAKALNTFFKRHHLRVFSQPGLLDGMSIWTASSTHDSGIGFASSQKTFIHTIDEDIDAERAKVAHDLLLTGCVDAYELVDRPWVPLDASNATGNSLVTDGRVAVLRLNECAEPRRADEPLAPQERTARPSLPRRIARNIVLSLRNDFVRGNPVYQGFEGVRLAVQAIRHPANPFVAKFYILGGLPFQLIPGSRAHEFKLPSPQRHPGQPISYETFLEVSVSGGYSGFGNSRFSTQNFGLFGPAGDGGSSPGQIVSGNIAVPTAIHTGGTFAVNVAFNTRRHLSHELGFTMNPTKLGAAISSEIPPSAVVAKAQIRQFNYALLLHARPNGTRLRPYMAFGAGLQMVRLTDLTQSDSSLLMQGFKQLGVAYTAYRFTSGIFQPTLHYGAGIKYHLTRRFLLRADFRETLSQQPDFWTKSYPAFHTISIGSGTAQPTTLETHGPLRHQRMSLGFGITL